LRKASKRIGNKDTNKAWREEREKEMERRKGIGFGKKDGKRDRREDMKVIEEKDGNRDWMAVRRQKE
jgi:hypothetical protein